MVCGRAKRQRTTGALRPARDPSRTSAPSSASPARLMAGEANEPCGSMRATMFAAYRATGADLPWGDPRGYHGVGMEGYFWRITHAPSGTVVVVLAAVNRDAAGGTWGLVALAAHPGGFVRTATAERVRADRRRLGLHLRAGDGRTLLAADDQRLRVDLGPGAAVDV